MELNMDHSEDIDLNEAAANARKLALSTNSSFGSTWQTHYNFDFYSQIPPPQQHFYQNSQFPSLPNGINFSSPPPQMPISPRATFQSRQTTQLYRQRLSYYKDFQNPISYSGGLQTTGTANSSFIQKQQSTTSEESDLVARNPELNHIGPKPIRFSLNTTGKKHVFSKPNNLANQQLPRPLMPGLIQNGVTRPLQGTVKPITDPYSTQIQQHQKIEMNTIVNNGSGFGLTNGSSWAGISSANDTSNSLTTGAVNSKPDTKATTMEFKDCMNSENWPVSLRNYVEKWFTVLAKGDAEVLQKGESLLQEKLHKVYLEGNFITTDWTKEPFPILPPSCTTKLGFGLSSSIPGTVKGTPLKSQTSVSVISSRKTTNNVEGFKNRNQKRPKGVRGRNRFRSSSSSRSHSRSRSSSSRSSSSERSKKKRNITGKTKNQRRKEKKKANAKNKKMEKEKKGSFYNEFGSFGAGVAGAESKARLNARAARFANEEENPKSTGIAPSKSMKSRLGGFISKDDKGLFSWEIDTSSIFDESNVGPSWDMDTKIVGTSTSLEKKYLRLTTAPDPSTIRPVSILEKSLEHVKNKWKEGSVDYHYICDQLKSIRQDLTVQRVRESFTIRVYETHARIALEKGDHEEFNQCQSQLVQLYSALEEGTENRLEFIAYRILYYVFTCSTLDLSIVVRTLRKEETKDECVCHALKIRKAWALGNYSELFKLYKTAPRMSSYLIDWFMNRERKNALRKILKSYRPSVPKSFLFSQLHLESDEEWNKFLISSQMDSIMIYTDPPLNTKINSRDSYTTLVAVLGG